MKKKGGDQKKNLRFLGGAVPMHKSEKSSSDHAEVAIRQRLLAGTSEATM